MKKGKHTVFVAENEIVRQREVVIGERFSGTVEIRSGLEKDELVVTAGYLFLYDQANIEIKGEE